METDTVSEMLGSVGNTR